MAQDWKALKEAAAMDHNRAAVEPHQTESDRAAREAVSRESSDRYRNFVEQLNRMGDREIERALQRA